MKLKLPTCLILLLLETIAGARTLEEGNIWINTGPYTYQTQTAHALPKAPRLGWGLVAAGDLDDNAGLEIGMIYLDKTYLRRQGDAMRGEHIKRMYVTTGYRRWLSAPFSVGLSIFSSYSMGDVKPLFEEGTSDKGFLTTAHSLTEYGADLSLQWEIFTHESFAIIADARYSKSLSAKKREKADQIGAMLAFAYLMPKPRR